MKFFSALLPLAALAAFAAAPAGAQELRDFCPDRPGLGTPPCTIDPGHADVEIGLADWTLDRSQGTRTDDVNFGETLVRVGLNHGLEAQIGWTAIGIERIRDPSGQIHHSRGTGDLFVGLKQNLVHPDGSGFSAALLPFATLPTGTGPLRSGTWGAGLLAPLSYSLPHGVQLAFTAEADAAPNGDGQGRHLAYDGVLGLEVDLTKQAGVTFELAGFRDEDPAGSNERLIGAVSLAWKPRAELQLDAGLAIAIAGQAPDLGVSVGISRRF